MNPKTRNHASPPSETFAYRGAEWHRKSLGTTGLMYDGDNVVADLDGSTVSRFYVTPMLDRNLSMTVTSGPQAGTYWYSQDERQSVRTLTDSTGAVVARYDYTAFGEPVPVAGSPSPVVQQRFTYTGRELNPYSGSFCLRYRTYTPGTGIFTARDPLGYVDGLGLYQGYLALFLQIDSWGLQGKKKPVSIVSTAADLSGGKVGNLADMIQYVQGLIDYECECLSKLEINGHGNPWEQYIGSTADQQPLKRDRKGLYYVVGGRRIYVAEGAANFPDLQRPWATEISAQNVAYVGGKLKKSFPWCDDCTIYLSGCNTGLLRGANTWPQALADATGCQVVATMGFTTGTFLGNNIDYSTYAGGYMPDWYYTYIHTPGPDSSVHTYPLSGNAFDEDFYGSIMRRPRTFYPRGGAPRPISQPAGSQCGKCKKK